MGQRLHRRVAAILGKPILSWVVTPPAEVNGTGAETKYSDYVTIPDPKPKEAGLYAVPAPKLELAASGSLIASVQCVDADDAVITEATLQTLAAAGSSTALAIGSTGNTAGPNGMTDETGTFYGAWSALAAAIPAGTAYLFGLNGYMVAGGIDPWFVYPPYTHHVTYTLYLDLGDAAENVLASIEIATHDWAYGTPFDVVQSVVAAFKSGQSISLASPAAKKRAKMVVTSNHYCQPYARLDTGGYAEAV